MYIKTGSLVLEGYSDSPLLGACVEQNKLNRILIHELQFLYVNNDCL